MSTPDPESRETHFQIIVPPELERGAYANFLSVWHTPYEFTLDFAVIQPSPVAEEDDPNSPVTVPCPVVARVKIPVTLVFDVLRALNENMTRFESRFGEIQRPGERPQEDS